MAGDEVQDGLRERKKHATREALSLAACGLVRRSVGTTNPMAGKKNA